MKLRQIILSAILAAGCIFTSVGCSSNGSSVGNTGDITLADGDTIAEITVENYGTITAKLFPDLAPKAVENFTLLAEQGYYNGLKIHRVVNGSFVQGGSLNGDGTGGTALIDSSGSFDVETSDKARHYYGALSYSNTNGDNTTQFFIVTNHESQDITVLDADLISAKAEEYTQLKTQTDTLSNEYYTYEYKSEYYTRLAEMIKSADDSVIEKYSKVGGIPNFDGGYTVFGQVYDGFDVLDALNLCEVENNAYGEASKPVEDIVISSVKIYTYIAPGTGEAEDNSKTSIADAIVDDNEAIIDGNESAIDSDENSDTASDTASEPNEEQ